MKRIISLECYLNEFEEILYWSKKRINNYFNHLIEEKFTLPLKFELYLESMRVKSNSIV